MRKIKILKPQDGEGVFAIFSPIKKSRRLFQQSIDFINYKFATQTLSHNPKTTDCEEQEVCLEAGSDEVHLMENIPLECHRISVLQE